MRALYRQIKTERKGSMRIGVKPFSIGIPGSLRSFLTQSQLRRKIMGAWMSNPCSQKREKAMHTHSGMYEVQEQGLKLLQLWWVSTTVTIRAGLLRERELSEGHNGKQELMGLCGWEPRAQPADCCCGLGVALGCYVFALSGAGSIREDAPIQGLPFVERCL